MKLGTNTISNVKLGSSQVNAVYLGSNLVWQNASVPVAIAATGISDTSFTANWNAYTGAIYYLLDVSLSSSFSTFVLQDQIVLTNSYVVTGLSSNTTYYYRVRASTDFDSDAQAFFNRVTTAGGTLSATEQNAVNTLVIQMKIDGIWSAMKAIYPMVGASAAACAQNLKSSSFTGTFTSGWTFASTGATPNGTSAYLDTNLNPNNELSLNTVHLSVYNRTNATMTGIIGSSDASLANALYLYPRYSNNTEYTRMFSDSGPGTTSTNSIGHWISTRVSSTYWKVFRNNTTHATYTISTSVKTTKNIYIGAGNINGVPEYGAGEFAFASIGDGLTDTESSNFYTAVQAFQTTLSRQV
jgi:hypothetical protein